MGLRYECIGTNGYYLPGFVIFKGKQIQENWIPNAGVDKETVLNVSENGWTDSEIALDWIKHFDAYTKIRTREIQTLNSRWTYFSFPFAWYCEANNIVPICFPPHSTHPGCWRLLPVCEGLS